MIDVTENSAKAKERASRGEPAGDGRATEAGYAAGGGRAKQSAGVPIHRIRVAAYTIPTDAPESDGTLEWSETTMVVVHASAGGCEGMGYTYGVPAIGPLIDATLADVVRGQDAMSPNRAWQAMCRKVRNSGRTGVCMMAISAVDNALWDVKARLLDVPLVTLLGQVRRSCPIYGSGGFTSYDESRLRRQLGDWVEAGIPRVKMKVGREPQADERRVAAAREAIGEEAELFVDANGAYSTSEALHYAHLFHERFGVTWLEEPRPSEDLSGLGRLRSGAPPGLDVAAGEYGYTLADFRRLLEADAVDVLQADITRCGGVTGFMRAAALAAAFDVPLSAHCAPAGHLHAACAAPGLRHAEYFHDHARIEGMLFDGAAEPCEGALQPDLSRPGNGVEFREQDARRYRVFAGKEHR